MEIKIGQTYVDESGYQIQPLKQIYGDCYICYYGYNAQKLLDNHMSRAALNIEEFSYGNYNQILWFYRADSILEKYTIDDDEFVPFMSLNELSNTSLNIEVGKYYYDSISNYVIEILDKFEDKFYTYNYCNMVFIIETLEIINIENYPFSPTWFNFVSDFNDISHWVEIPKEYWDISSGVYGTTTEELDSKLKRMKRKKILEKIYDK